MTPQEQEITDKRFDDGQPKSRLPLYFIGGVVVLSGIHCASEATMGESISAQYDEYLTNALGENVAISLNSDEPGRGRFLSVSNVSALQDAEGKPLMLELKSSTGHALTLVSCQADLAGEGLKPEPFTFLVQMQDNGKPGAVFLVMPTDSNTSENKTVELIELIQTTSPDGATPIRVFDEHNPNLPMLVKTDATGRTNVVLTAKDDSGKNVVLEASFGGRPTRTPSEEAMLDFIEFATGADRSFGMGLSNVELTAQAATQTAIPPTAEPTPTPRDENAPTEKDAFFDNGKWYINMTDKDGTAFKAEWNMETKRWNRDVVNEFGDHVKAEFISAKEYGSNLEGWYTQKGDVHLIPQGDLPKDSVQLVFESPIEMHTPKIGHTPNKDSGKLTTSNLATSIWSQLGERWTDEAPKGEVRTGRGFYSAFTSPSGAEIHFTDVEGKTHTFNASQGKVTVRAVDWNTAVNDSRFKEYSLVHDKVFLVFTTGDGKGGINSFIASERPIDSLPPSEVQQMMLASLDAVLVANDQSMVRYGGTGGFLVKFNQTWMSDSTKAGKGGSPAIDIKLPPSP